MLDGWITQKKQEWVQKQLGPPGTARPLVFVEEKISAHAATPKSNSPCVVWNLPFNQWDESFERNPDRSS